MLNCHDGNTYRIFVILWATLHVSTVSLTCHSTYAKLVVVAETLWRWNFARCLNPVVQGEYGPSHRLSREIFSVLITSSDYVSFNLTATSLFSVDCLLPSPSPSPTSPLPFASPSSSHHFPYPHRKGPWDSRVSLLQCWCHQLSSDGGCSVKDLCVSRALHPSTADPFHWLQLWRLPTVQHPQVWSCVSEWACHMTITWLSHAIIRMTATCCSLVHYCHMIVTRLSRDCHMTVTWLSHDCHIPLETVSWFPR